MIGGVALTAMTAGFTSLGALRMDATWAETAAVARARPAKAVRVQRFMV
jgi:hypothetical protein